MQQGDTPVIRWLQIRGGVLLAGLLLGFATDLSACHLQTYPVALQAERGPAFVKVTLPADAVLEVDGVKTKQTGATRLFATPALEKGKKYSYQLKVTYSKDGKD